MVTLRRLLAALLSLCFFGVAWAQSACQVEYRGTHSQKGGYLVVEGRSVENLTSVCAWGNSVYPVASGAPTYQLVGAGATSKCGQWVNGTYQESGIGVTVQKWYLKPDGTATQTDPGNICQGVNQCTANAGKPTTLRVTIGYTRSPDDNDSKAVGPTFNPWNGAPVCSGGCTMNYSGVESAWISQSPNAQGLYRNSVDATYVNSGQTCSASGTNPADQAVNPQATQPDCPGYVGEVNGKLGCYGTAVKPVTTGTKPTGIPQPPPKAGNPPAGERPVSGEGSAANPTPTAGNGGPSGGPAAAGVGGKGGGAGGTSSGTGTTTNAEGKEEKDPCGAPGQAVCNVKVDETGTPANGGDGMGTTKLNEVMDKADQGIAKAIDSSTMDTSWGGIPQWFASGGCTPWNLGTLPIINRVIVIDICPVAGYVVAVMSFLWVVGTFFAIIAMVGRVTGAGAH